MRLIKRGSMCLQNGCMCTQSVTDPDWYAFLLNKCAIEQERVGLWVLK